ncbi:MAG: outer rane transport energization protein ExbD [Candidatus Angelobacter sp.]|nr:outer rane transport energization protein ExbD [Candidatus Angelobacter sp.]
MLRDRLRSNRRICRIDFSAFAAIVAALLTLLIWATPHNNPHHGVSVDLPNARHSLELWGARREDALMIFILRDGQLFFGNQKVTPEELSAKLRIRVHGDVTRKVYIRADGRVRYSIIASVLESVCSAGLSNVAFLTEQLR